MSADAILHDRLSFFLNATAIYPPKRPSDGFELLDILAIRPDGTPGRMLEPTQVNLTHLPLSRSETRKLQAAKHSAAYNDSEPRRLAYASSWTPEFEAALAYSSALRVSASGKNERTHVTDLQIGSETAERISGDAGSLVEDIVMNHLNFLLTKTAFKNFLRRRMLFGVVVKVLRGCLSASVQALRNSDFEASVAASQAADASLRAGTVHSEGTAVIGEGVVGVHMLCFIAKFDRDGCHVSAPIPTIRADKREFAKARQWVRAGRWRAIGVLNVFSGRGVFKAMQVARADDPRLTPEDRQKTAAIFSMANSVMSATDVHRLPGSFGGVDGAQLWNGKAIKDPRGRNTGEEDSETVLVSDLTALDETEIDRLLRWRRSDLLVDESVVTKIEDNQ